jgi:hypothetical protein
MVTFSSSVRFPPESTSKIRNGVVVLAGLPVIVALWPLMVIGLRTAGRPFAPPIIVFEVVPLTASRV